MNSYQRFQLTIFLVLVISFQKLVAQPQFIIQDKVIFVSGGNAPSSLPNNTTSLAPNTSDQTPKTGSVIEDAVIFATGSSVAIKLDSIHKKLMNLKRGTSEKVNNFHWFNAHPTNSMNIEGFSVIITSTTTLPAKTIAEVRLARQKTNVWIDTKFNKPTVLHEIKNVIYSQQNRRADIETFGGYKFSLSIDATTGKITLINALPNTVEVRIYKTPKLL